MRMSPIRAQVEAVHLSYKAVRPITIGTLTASTRADDGSFIQQNSGRSLSTHTKQIQNIIVHETV